MNVATERKNTITQYYITSVCPSTRLCVMGDSLFPPHFQLG